MSKTWFITGTSSGLGRGLVERALERGDRVAATLRRTDALDDLRATYGDRLWTARLDVTDAAAVRSTVDAAAADLGRLDVVVSNAGYGLFGAVEEATDEQVRRQIETNLLGSAWVIRAALPHLRAQGGGRILQVSSAGGQTTYPNFGLYHASKWGIEGLAETLAQEVAPLGIGVTIVEPGATPTEFGAGLDRATVSEAYDRTPAGDVRRAVADGSFEQPGDAEKVVAAIIASVDDAAAPLRLPLGPDTYADVRASLVARLEALDAARDVALSVARHPVA
ncbi:SDR family oxidoreductase [Patulibacter sp.]|uniref:SDR family oxidoreductase n=1 Tax=Patulibacter sp. TaxID=1912859 RepID=UPI00271A0270|nr:SDR family oxidoreductase [Patulibacter sp.]MDO9407020.1 SDR family oxidoreductase [Patulibacter sp.]